jgi:hypothetical protein
MRAIGGMIALELKGGLQAGRAFMDSVQLATRAVSPGDAETLVQHPARMTHATYDATQRAKHGFTDGLIRSPLVSNLLTRLLSPDHGQSGLCVWRVMQWYAYRLTPRFPVRHVAVSLGG